MPSPLGGHGRRRRGVTGVTMIGSLRFHKIPKVAQLAVARQVPSCRADALHTAGRRRAARTVAHRGTPIVQITVLTHQDGVVAGRITKRQCGARIRNGSRHRCAIRIASASNILTQPTLLTHLNRMVHIAVNISNGIHSLAGLHRLRHAHPDDGSLLGVKLVCGRIEVGEEEIAVVITTPSPVEMEVVVSIVTITHKSVSTRITLSIVIDGTQTIQFRFNKEGPSIGGIIGAFHPHTIGISEIGLQSTRYIGGVGAAAQRAVHHLHTDTAMEQQLSHGVHLHRAGVRRQLVGHHIVLIGRVGKIGTQCSIVAITDNRIIGHIAVAARTRGRILPIAHNLSHGGSHAPDISMVVRASSIGRTHIVVIAVLVPSRGQQG